MCGVAGVLGLDVTGCGVSNGGKSCPISAFMFWKRLETEDVLCGVSSNSDNIDVTDGGLEYTLGGECTSCTVTVLVLELSS